MSQPLLEAAAKLEQLVRSAPHLLLCLDFDGTLAPLAAHPEDVSMAPPVRKMVRELAAKDKVTVAVISGRNRGDLQKRVRITNLYYVGNHGLEISGPGVLFIEPTAAAGCDRIKELAAELERKLERFDGGFVENKGLTLSVHYRMAAAKDHEPVRQIVQGVLAKAGDPFELKAGHKVYEIRPRVSWNKGSAVGWIRQQLPWPDPLVLYMGDDDTDEDAFAALPAAITVRVGCFPETAAHYRVDNPGEVQAFLRWLLERVN